MAAKHKGLKSLIRLSDAALNERRRELNAVEERELEIKRLLDELEEEKRREQKLAPELERAREALSEAFQELKRYEIALDQRKKSEKAEAERKTTLMLDEISLNMHRRRQEAAE